MSTRTLTPRIAAALLALGLSSAATAQVTITEAWVRGTVATQKATGAFMQLTAVKDARLVSARSPVAGVVEIHEMTMDNNVMRMRQIPGLDLAAGRTVSLKPGGLHVMLMDLKQPLKAGDVVPLTLSFEDARTQQRYEQEVKASVTGLGAAPAANSHDSHAGHAGMKH